MTTLKLGSFRGRTYREDNFDYNVGRVPGGSGGITSTSAPRPQEFPWGDVIRCHVVGEYSIVEFTPHLAGNVDPKSYDPYATHFHVYVDRIDTHHSYYSLDAALAGAIALKYDGINTRADTYFLRAIQAD